MSPEVQQPIIYLITSGATNNDTTPASEEFDGILKLVAAAVAAKVSLIQLREKHLTACVLYELAVRAAKITQASQTQLLVNDRADIASAAGADGVHLTTQSLRADVIRATFGPSFLIGVSTHSLEQARKARDNDADFAVWGPVFATESKRVYGEPQGVAKLAEVVRALAPFPILALGGVNLDNLTECFEVGARGIAGISLFQDQKRLAQTVSRIHEDFLTNVGRRNG
jgi:thiamine-phosphate pyrophosphorylase